MKKKQNPAPAAAVGQLRSGGSHGFSSLDRYVPLGDGESRLYESMREAVPLLDAAALEKFRLKYEKKKVKEDAKAARKAERQASRPQK